MMTKTPSFLALSPPRRSTLYRSLIPRGFACVTAILLVIVFARPATASTGGPDTFGYSFTDSTEPGGPAYSWVNIFNSGASVVIASDNVSSVSPPPNGIGGPVTLGAPFPFYGTNYAQLVPSSNGYLTTDLNDLGPDWSNDGSLPTVLSSPAGSLGARIYPLHDDLHLDGPDKNVDGTVLYQYFATSPHPHSNGGVSVFTWNFVRFDGSSGNADLTTHFWFQTLLFNNGDIIYQYDTTPPGGGSSSTTGIQSLGSNTVVPDHGLLYAANTGGSISGGLAVLITNVGVVTTSSDELNTPSHAGAGISLREAIRDAAPGNTITFDPSLNGQTITLGGTQLAISKNLTIDASALAAGITVSGNNASRVFHITSGKTVEMEGLTVRSGSASVAGGIFAEGSLSLKRVTVRNNSSTGRGGGLQNNATMTIENSTISGNTSADIGGGILNVGTLTITNSTLTGNNSTGTGGQGLGGAIFNFAFPLTIKHSTIAGNTGSQFGGGVRSQGGTLTLENTVIAGNTAPSDPDLLSSATHILNGVNLIGDNSSVATAFPAGTPNLNGDYVGTSGSPLDALLAPLGDYGGTTLTMPPRFGSPALDTAIGGEATDQRGVARPIGAGPDIGAVEATVSFAVTNTNDSGAGSLRDTIAQAIIPGSQISFAAGLSGQTITLTSGQLLINKDLSIEGTGLTHGITISGNNASRVMSIGLGSTTTIRNLSMTGGNSAGNGGAIECLGSLSLFNTAFFGNSASNVGGAIALPNAGTGNLIANNCTFANNSANFGGAFYVGSNHSGPFAHCTFSNNSGATNGGGIYADGTVTLSNTIVAGNSSGGSADVYEGAGTVSASGVNLVGNLTGSGLSAGPSVLVGDPLLAPLGYYGGPTQTMHPLIGSSAIDPPGGATSSSLSTDQRGFPRVVDGGRTTGSTIVDIGAVEAGPVLEVTNTNDSGAGSLRQQIIDAQVSPGDANHIVFDPNVFPDTIDAFQLTILSTVFLDASDIGNPGVAVTGGSSGQIFNIGVDATAAMHSIAIRDGRDGVNVSQGFVVLQRGSLTLGKCTVSNNRADLFGGAIRAQSDTRVVLDHCTVSGNDTTAAHGNDAGAIINSGELRLTHCTVTANQASNAGQPGGILVFAGTLTLENTIVAGNLSGSTPDIEKRSAGAIVLKGVNLFGDLNGSTLSAGPNLLVGGLPLAPLGDYGGKTQTQPPLPGNPALDALSSTQSTALTGQRGMPRPVGAAKDIGAVEAVPLSGLGPADAATLLPLLPTVTWSGPAGVQFDVLIGTDPNNLTSAPGFETSPFVPQGLTPGATYFWRIDSTFGGATARSAVRSFMVRPNVVVTTEVDENNGFGVGGDSLREVIAEAVNGETILFAAGLSGKRCVLTNGQLLINEDLTIDASALTYGFIIDANGPVNTHRVLRIAAGTVTMKTLTITGGNVGGNGGGIENLGSLTLENSTLSGNKCTSHGGGIYNGTGGTLELTNCTVVKNSASGLAGGVYVIGGSTATITHTTIFGNRAGTGGGGLRTIGTTTFTNSIVAGNTSSSGEADIRNAGTVTGQGINLIGDNSSVTVQFPEGAPNGNGEFAGTAANPLDPMLSALGYYGGPNETMHPLIGSHAIDPAGGATSSPLSTDQRGLLRVVDGDRTTGSAIVDIGAVEAGTVLEVTTTTDNVAGSLRTHLASAAAAPGNESRHIVFSPATFPGTITFAARPHINSSTVFIDASDISGTGVHVSGGGTNGVFFVNSTGTAAMHSLTIRDGSASDGGGVSNFGTLTMVECTVSNNTATARSGGVHNSDNDRAVLDHCTISNNQTTASPIFDAGAIYTNGPLRLTHCTISENQASTFPGGIYIHSSGQLTLENTIVAGNTGTTSEIFLDGGSITQKGVNLIGDLTGSGLTPSATLLTGDAKLAPLANYSGPTATHALPTRCSSAAQQWTPRSSLPRPPPPTSGGSRAWWMAMETARPHLTSGPLKWAKPLSTRWRTPARALCEKPSSRPTPAT